MEESLQSHNQNNNKSLLPFPTSLLQTLYVYSCRYLPNMEKDKNQQSSNEQIMFDNQPLVKQAKQKVQYNYDTLNNYIDNLDQKLQQLNKNQLDNLSEKHRYFLRKFKKYVAQHEKLSQIYESLQNTVIQNPSVQEQINSINFINMVSMQTQQKLAKLKSTVTQAENQKINNQIKIQQLRKQLNSLKSEFFAKKRQQVSYRTQIQTRQKRVKERQLQQKMKKIRIQKRQKDTLIKDIFNAKTQNSQEKFQYFKSTKRNQQDPCFSSIDSALEQFKSINNSSKQYLRSLVQTKQNFRNRKLQERKRLNNKLVEETNLQNFRIKSRQQNRFRKSEEDQLMKNQKIVKQTQKTNKLHEQFMKMSSKQILNILTENKKLKNLLQIIEEIKATEIKQDVIEKRNINFFRSQVYKSNTPYLTKNNQSFEDLINSVIMR